MEQPLVSVIMAAYRAQETIGAAISSCLTQTYPNLEVVVCDDGSDDGTAEIARAHGSRVVVVNQANGGCASARNAAIAAASGELMMVCDSDDLLLPPLVEEYVAIHQRKGGGRRMVTTQSYLLTPQGIHPRRLEGSAPPPPERQRRALLERNWVSIFAMFPRTMLDEVGGFDDSLRLNEDWDLWLRAVFAGYTVEYQPRPLAMYRWTGGSASTSGDAMYTAEDVVLRATMEREQDRGNLREDEQTYLQRRLSSGSPRRLVSQAETALRAGDLARSRGLFAEASELMPGDRKLRLRATAARVPGGARLLAQRQHRIDRQVGWHQDMQR